MRIRKIYHEYLLARQQLREEGYEFNGAYTFVVSAFFVTMLLWLGLAFWNTLQQGGDNIAAINILYFIAITVSMGFSITFYQHRVVSHNSAKLVGNWAGYFIHLVFIYLQTSTFQGSILTWGADHRTHHGNEDKPQDPYSTKKIKGSTFWGYLWSHFWCYFYNTPAKYQKAFDASLVQQKRATDGRVLPIYEFQHSHYDLIAVLGLLINGFWMMLLFGSDVSLPSYGMGVFYMAAFIGMVHQVTWLVNSFTHTRDEQHSGKTSSRSAVRRPTYLILSALPLGEGNHHDGHHAMPTDFFNGNRDWWTYDPTGWLGQVLEFLKLAQLKRLTPDVVCKQGWIGSVQVLAAQYQWRKSVPQEVKTSIDACLADVKSAWKRWDAARKSWQENKTEELKKAMLSAQDAVDAANEVFEKRKAELLQQLENQMSQSELMAQGG